MSEGMSVNLPVDVPGEKYCALCGADEKTGEELTGGFLPVMVFAPDMRENLNPVRWRFLCAGCLTMVLRACRIGWAGQVAELSVASPYLGDPA